MMSSAGRMLRGAARSGARPASGQQRRGSAATRAGAWRSVWQPTQRPAPAAPLPSSHLDEFFLSLHHSPEI